MKTTLNALSVCGLFSLSACFWGDENNWASQQQVIEAAGRCGISNFEPTKAGAAWAAYVKDTVPDAKKKEDCIYNDLKSQDLLVTR